jgi:DNA-binding NarL/FixJ family response regulator
MPGKNGLAVLEELDFNSLSTRVIVLTAAEDDGDAVRAMRLGARGICRPRAMNAFAESSDGGARRDKPLLTDRETQVVLLIAQGQRNKEIGESRCR